MGGRNEPLTEARKRARAAGDLADDVEALIETLLDCSGVTDVIGGYVREDEFRVALLEAFSIEKPAFTNFRTGSGAAPTHSRVTRYLIDLFAGDRASRSRVDIGPIVRNWLRTERASLLNGAIRGLNDHLGKLALEAAAHRKAERDAKAEAASTRLTLRTRPSDLEARFQGVATPVREAASGALVPTSSPRAAFLRTPTLQLLRSGVFAPRPDAEAGLLSAYSSFHEARETARSEFKIPVFWIRGRSGDGKSVLLLQLARQLAQDTNGAVLLCDSPENLIQALGQLSAADREPIVLVVDDLHKAQDERLLAEAFERASELQLDLTVLTCGPTHERNAFMRSQSAIWSPAKFGFKAPNLGADAAQLSALLGIEISSLHDDAPTLVEQVYLALIGAGEGETSLKRFAESLRDRVGRGGHDGDVGALAQIAAFTWMDVPFPRQHLDPEVRDRVEALSDETQLHFEINGDEVRFGHPAIARPIFDALSTEAGVATKIETRLVKAMAPILRQLDDRTRRFAVRQIKTRLTNETGASPLDVLTSVYAAAGGATVGSAVVALLLPELSGAGAARWLSVARGYRQNTALPPQVRAEIATTLALLNPPHSDDVKWVFEKGAGLTDVSPHLGRGMLRLIADRTNFRYVDWTIDWLQAYPDHREAQNIVVSLLSNHLDRRGVRAAAMKFLEETDVRVLKSPFVAKLVELLEEEAESKILDWLAAFRGTPQAANVLKQLLGKHGGRWLSAALAHVRLGPSRPSWNQSLAASIVRKAWDGEEALRDEILQAAESWADVLVDEGGTGEFFAALTPYVAESRFRSLVDRRLAASWGTMDALILLRDAWRHVRVADAEYQRWGMEVCGWVLDETSADRPAEITQAAAMEAFRQMLTSNHRLVLLLPSAHGVIVGQHGDTHRARLAGQLLKHLARARLGVLSGSPDSDAVRDALEPHASLYRSVAWSAARSAGPEAIGALTGLVELAEPDDLSELGQAVRDHLYAPEPHSTRVLASWIRTPATQSDALTFVLDASTDTRAQNKLRSNALARSIDVALQWTYSGGLSARDIGRIGRLLAEGVADFQTNPSSAWALFQRHDSWPEPIVQDLWLGVLRASLHGRHLRRDVFWSNFEPWYIVTRDPSCKAALMSVGLA